MIRNALATEAASVLGAMGLVQRAAKQEAAPRPGKLPGGGGGCFPSRLQQFLRHSHYYKEGAFAGGKMKMPFGKYCGRDIDSIAACDRQYLLWLSKQDVNGLLAVVIRNRLWVDDGVLRRCQEILPPDSTANEVILELALAHKQEYERFDLEAFLTWAAGKTPQQRGLLSCLPTAQANRRRHSERWFNEIKPGLEQEAGAGSPGWDVPELDRVVRTPRSQGFAIGAKHDGEDGIRMALERGDVLASGYVP